MSDSHFSPILKEISPENNNLLVSFGGINAIKGYAGIPPFEFFNFLKTYSLDKIFIRDIDQAWYHKGFSGLTKNIDESVGYLNELINEKTYDKVIFIGNSCGGYAAFLFGLFLNVDEVHSFSPQTFIDPVNRFLNFDRRWRRQIKKIYKYDGAQRAFFDLKNVVDQIRDTELNIYYSSQHRLDLKHGSRIKHPNIKHHVFDYGGHGVIKELRDNGTLNSIFEKL